MEKELNSNIILNTSTIKKLAANYIKPNSESEFHLTAMKSEVIFDDGNVITTTLHVIRLSGNSYIFHESTEDSAGLIEVESKEYTWGVYVINSIEHMIELIKSEFFVV